MENRTNVNIVNRRISALALSLALLLSACGRGGGGGSEKPADSADPSQTVEKQQLSEFVD